MKPAVKAIYPIIKENSMYQIGDEPHFAVEIDDSEQFFDNLLPLLKGELTIPEIHKSLVNTYPEISLEEVNEAIEALDDMGILENSDIDQQSKQSQLEIDRYRSNMNFFSAFSSLTDSKYDFQNRLIHAKVLVLGMGGLGSNVLYQLAGLGVGHIVTVDYDVVELKNLNRQVLYSESQLGKNKTDVGISRLKDFNSNISFHTFNKKITCESDLEEIITSDLDLVICAADSPPVDIILWVNKYCLEKNVPYISGGTGVTLGQFFTVLPHISPCTECYYSEIIQQNKALFEATTKLTNTNAAIAPNISMVASLICMESIRVLLGIAEPISAGKRTLIDFITSSITQEKEWKRTCKNCVDNEVRNETDAKTTTT
ncbi:ThiF family adenylyltransferase [Alkalihalobacterium chitinilyticum]|uniref:ThiF family adenylyltransferase n=1 Tax=Alkalihalobacterium chitinilyticum TaxID=2980103 RepID=A0ABT5VIX4_9BACI|nr:ThiF family adenylyltransferase [Alkalihalobacterium chitinilyticum]MDE5415398.1 ThiF family adenylyltransferase [Alkalihalobacterium chitinilyticum]